MTRTIAIAIAVVAFATAAAPAAASSGLVGQWRLDEGAGTTAADSSGFGDAGTLAGGAVWTVTPRASALNFDGSTGRLEIPDASQLEPSTAVTVSAWIIRRGSPGSYRYIVAKGATRCIAASYGLYSGPHGGLQFYVSHNNGTQYARSPDAGLGVWDGNWHFVVGTYDGSTIRLYVDGTQVSSGTSDPGALSYQLKDSNDLFIGDYPGCAWKNFLGNIADVQLWNRALSAEEIADLINPPTRPVLPPPVNRPLGPPLVAPWSSPVPASPGTKPPLLTGLVLTRSNFTTHGIGTLTIGYTHVHGGRVRLTLLRQRTIPCRTHSTPGAICTRYVVVGSFSHNDSAGRNIVRLPSRLRHLKQGRYRVVVKLVGSGRSVAVNFRVVG